MKSSRNSVAGFTITELLIVITIVGVLATIALPSFKSLTESQRVRNASYELHTILSLARSEAIKRNNDVKATLQFSGSVLTSIDVIVVASGAIIDTKPAPKGVDITPSASATSGVTYTRNGRTTITAAPVTFKLDVAGAATPTNNISCITIELSGMPRMRKGACS